MYMKKIKDVKKEKKKTFMEPNEIYGNVLKVTRKKKKKGKQDK